MNESLEARIFASWVRKQYYREKLGEDFDDDMYIDRNDPEIAELVSDPTYQEQQDLAREHLQELIKNNPELTVGEAMKNLDKFLKRLR